MSGESPRPALYLVDSFALAFRIFYAFARNPLVNALGEDTSVAHGYWGGILRLLAMRKPSHFAIVTDPGGPNFRHELYPEYKANRGEMPEEMRRQLPMLDELVKASGVPFLIREGFEADDLMASLARQFSAQGADVFLVTKDKDLSQLVDDRIRLLVMEKGGDFSEIGPAQVEEKWGVPPSQIRDLLALMGDASDNVPGVPKVGPKTAAELLKQYGTLEGVYANLDSVARKALKANLETGRDNAYLSQKLVSLREDLDLGLSLDDLAYRGLAMEALSAAMQAHHLNSLDKQLQSLGRAEARRAVVDATFTTDASAQVLASALPGGTSADPVGPEYVLVNSPETWGRLEAAAVDCWLAAVDTETDSLASRTATLVGLCISFAEDVGFYVPIAHKTPDGAPHPLNQDADRVRSLLATVFADGREVVCHNSSFDLDVLEHFGVQPACTVHDSMVGAWMLDPGGMGAGLDEQVLGRLGHAMIPIVALIGKGKQQKTFDLVDPVEAAPYGAEDAVFTLRLWNRILPELRDKGLWRAYAEQELPLVPCLRHMEAAGIAVDGGALQVLGVELVDRMRALEQEIWSLCGREFNLNSPKQLGEVLFVDLLLPGTRKTSSGYSTAAEVLEELRDHHPVIPRILEYRELQKLNGTYVETLPRLVDPATGRLHTSFSQIGAATGRLASRDPNLQNIPVRTPLGRRIRSAFRAVPENLLISADYSQIELRVLAHLSGDEGLVESFRDGVDVHARTAAAVFGIPLSDVTADMRRQAKAVNFGVLYGMSAFRLARDFGISRAAAKEFIDGWFHHFGKVRAFIDQTIAEARSHGYVTTLAGRRRYLPGLSSPNHLERSNAERMAINSPVQGSAADIIKVAMVRIHRRIEEQKLPLSMLLQVHDELVFECPEAEAAGMGEVVRSEMQTAYDLSVPLEVGVGIGKSWDLAH